MIVVADTSPLNYLIRSENRQGRQERQASAGCSSIVQMSERVFLRSSRQGSFLFSAFHGVLGALGG
jgi:hypothetical protein